jgi:MoxR-like ATPase
MPARDDILELKRRMSRSILGQDHVVERLIMGLLANGNLLVEGLPGLAKTRAVKALAANLEVGLSRIQFTPDLLPSDITGSEIYYSSGGTGEFKFQPGPIFNNLVLADEINRAPAKVQAALLEAMEERQVTVAGTTHKLPDLFLVMATENPIEQEGTYPLPEAQTDRFLMKVLITYPDETAEGSILELVRSEEASAAPAAAAAAKPAPIAQQSVFDAREEIHQVTVAAAVQKYVVDLVFATRYPERYSEPLKKWIQIGASPRGGIALDKCSRAYAWLQGKDFVTPDEVKAVAHDCLRHRVLLSYEASAEGVTADQVVDEVLKVVAPA